MRGRGRLNRQRWDRHRSSGGILVNPSATRSRLPGLPLLWPNAGVVDRRCYATLNDRNPVWWDGNEISLPRSFGRGTIDRAQDVAITLTKVWGSHTSKAGFSNNHSFKAHNTGAGPGAARPGNAMP